MDFMGIVNGLIGWASSNEWVAIAVAVLALIGAIDTLLLAALRVSNLLFPSVTWDDNFVNMVHGAISKVLGWGQKLISKKTGS